jgi:hypothetical protein
MSSRIERLRNLFLVAFFLLVISIIFTPLIVHGGFSIFDEEVLESIFLFVQVSLAWQIFRLYERTVSSREKEIQKLEQEYQRREKELLEAFAYLGKVNVQVSLIRSFLQKLKAPSNRKETESYISEILKIVLSLSGKKWATLRIIDMKNLQTLKEYWVNAAGNTQEFEKSGIKIGNKDIIKWEKNQAEGEKNGYFVFGSSGSELSPGRVFLVFRDGTRLEPDIVDFLRAATNQCEVLMTLFDLKSRKE